MVDATVEGATRDGKDGEGKQNEGLPSGVRFYFSQELETTDNPIPVGFVSDTKLAYGHWYTQPHCRCEWTVGLKCPAQEKRGLFVKVTDCNWRELLSKKPVDLVVFVGCRPPKHHPVWECREISLIVWIVQATASRRRGMTSPTNWEIETHHVMHSNLGGVTNGDFRISCARLKEGKRTIPWVWFYHNFQNNLGQVQSSIAPGAPAKISTVLAKGTLNAPFGLLDWKGRRGMVYSKSVFLEKQGKWVRRRLSPKELMDALDIPATVSYHTTDEESDDILDVPIPGKLISVAIGLTRSQEAGAVSSDSSEADEEPQAMLPSGSESNQAEETQHHSRSSFDLLAVQAAKSISAKATKADDSDVPDYIWNKFIIDGAPSFLGNSLRNEKGDDLMARPCQTAFLKIVSWMRKRMLCHWKQKVVKEMLRWHETYGRHISGDRAIVKKRMREVAYHVGWCSWWNWDRGSTLFFWRWPLSYMSDALFGVPPRFDSFKPNDSWNSTRSVESF